MSTAFADRLWPACLSALQLDRLLAGELDEVSARRVHQHLEGCSTCSSALEAMRAGLAERLPALRVVPLRPREHLWPRVIAAGAGMAAAAALLLVARPPAERAKGGGFALGMYVEHAGEVRRALPGEAVAPGDAVRFTVTTPAKAHVAVLSLDPEGRASVYFPLGSRAEAVAAGAELTLPLGTRLDGTLGEERIVGLFCSSPVELEPVRLQLEHGESIASEGCQVVRWSFVKR